jgi:ketosteroid isomerase-like protein
VSDVDVVRRFYDAWTAADLPAMLVLVDPEVEVEPILGVLYARESYRGRDDLAAPFHEIAARWERFEAHVEKARQVRDEVVAFVRLVGHRGEQSFEARIAVECRFRDGRIVSFRGRDVREAEEDLTLGL